MSIGTISTNLTFILMLIFLVKGIIDKRQFDLNLNRIYLALFLYMIVYSISYITTLQVDAFYYIQLILLFIFILESTRMNMGIMNIKLVGYIMGITVVFLFIHWIASGLSFDGFKSIFRNPNYLAVLLFCVLYFKIIAFKYSSSMEKVYIAFLIFINLILIFATNARSVLVAIGVIVVSRVVLQYYSKFFPYVFHMVIILNLLFLFIYTKIQNSHVGVYLNDLSLHFFGKPLYHDSGRSVIWEQLFQKISENPLFGYGLGTNAKDLIVTNYTAHNQFLQIIIEVGMVGFVIFIFLLYSIWKLLIKRLDSSVAVWSACFFLGILVYENFEMTLFQNNYSIAILQWMIITIGINFKNFERKID
ncbi:O-antigen ligase family protein [Oceanobacillus massiliensis]|uniref:O-antigen ligase family protein n=1 Tax=Oceanobacillus massiliensis TaxID=1465765 RepID=UPI001376481D|nr:O-antigen ligase family protein [Oceanobacillus massiliensis]